MPVGGTAAIDVTCGHDAGIFLPPLGHGDALAGTFVGAPLALSIGGEEAEAAAFDEMADAAGRWIVVVVEIHVSERVPHAFVAVAVVVTEDADVVPTGVHAGGESTDIDVAVIAFFAGVGIVQVAAADAEGVAAFVTEEGSAVAVAEIPAAIGSGIDTVQAVVMLGLLKAGEQDLATIHGGVKLHVPVHVGVHDDVRRVGDDHDIVKNRDAHGTLQAFFTDEDVICVRPAIAISILKYADSIALTAAAAVTAIIHALGHPDATGGIQVHIGGIIKHGRGGPDGDLQALGHLKHGRIQVLRRDL